jgi:hypothetical protein
MNDIDVDHPWVIVHLSDVHIPAACTLADRVLGPVDRFRQAHERHRTVPSRSPVDHG